MPVIPTVYNTIRPGDYQTNTVKAYKRYTVTNSTFSASGYRLHEGVWKLHTPDVGDPSITYPTNYDGTNQHVVWKSIDHRYYRNPYDPGNCHEGTNRQRTEKNYFISCSIMSCPYLDTGESIKPGSVTIIQSSLTLQDDGNGNLRYTNINTGSFASASRCFFYMSFNNEFRQFEYGTGAIATGSVEYTLRRNEYQADARNVTIDGGIDTTGAVFPIGLGAEIDADSTGRGGIRIPHNPIFNNFNSCDRWTISLWVYNTGNDATILAKGPVRTEPYLDPSTGKTSIRTVTYEWPDPLSDSSAYAKLRTPFLLYHSDTTIQFICSNGTTSTQLSATMGAAGTWNHIAIRRNNTNLALIVNGTAATTTSIPNESTANAADITIGCINGFTNAFNCRVDEIRFYDYAVSDATITSLRGRGYGSGTTLLQTNVVGNVFYRNGQIVVSSPNPAIAIQYIFDPNSSLWTATYRGVHRIYENEVLVRVPAGQFNYTLNPTATYRPGTAQDANDCNTTVNGAQSNNGPGDVYLDMFVSGTVGPYITTIGLYNDKAELIAVGKLANPVTKLDDVDMNFIIRWDY